MSELLGALDQGTTSTRFVVFRPDGAEVARAQLEHTQILPRPGWVEHDPTELWERSCAVIEAALGRAGISGGELSAIGIANQRETTIVWDRASGAPLANAIVWQDARTAELVAKLQTGATAALLRARTGLLPATYFSATKLSWLLDHVPDARARAIAGEVLFGTVDSWLVWKLTGGRVHQIDATNASRTMLMDLERRRWDRELLELFGIPAAVLPEIVPSVRTDPPLTLATGPLGAEVPVAGVLGDQQAAMLGQACCARGDLKCTYGTGSFVLANTGAERVQSASGLLSTLCYELASGPTYTLEGAVAVTGAAIQWLRDQLGVIGSAAESEVLAASVDDSAGLVFVPAFSGLFAPHWRPEARGVIAGLTRSHTAAHLARAALEAICYQCCEVVGALCLDSGIELTELRVDGGVASNDLCMQLQADVLGVPIVRPASVETTALGAAFAAGLAVGIYPDLAEIARRWRVDRRFEPTWSNDRRAAGMARWRWGVAKALDGEPAANPSSAAGR